MIQVQLLKEFISHQCFKMITICFVYDTIAPGVGAMKNSLVLLDGRDHQIKVTVDVCSRDS